MDIRDAFFGELFRIAQQDNNVIVLTADMGVNEFAKFRELKGQFYNVGISEQNMISMAAGLALQGKKVFCYSIIPFITMRAFEQIKVDICSMQLPVTIIGGCAGLSNATDGGTHHGIQDISIMRTLDITILNPNDSETASLSAIQSYQAKTPYYVRLDKGEFKPYEPRVVSDTMIIATGNMVERALEVSPDICVINMVQLKPMMHQEELLYWLCSVDRLITLEEHLNIGLGSIISEFMTDHNLHIPLKRIGVTTEKVVGSREYLQKHFGLDVESLRHAIENW